MRLSIAVAALVLGLCVAPGSAAAAIDGERYEHCGPVEQANMVGAARVSCSVARSVAEAVVAVSPSRELSALASLGWQPLRARAADGGRAHDLIALRGVGAVWIRRPGPAPDVDGWTAGRELIFSRHRIVGGKPVPRDASACTSAFLIRQRGGVLAGLSAAHCGGLRRSDRLVQRRNAALRRPPAPGIVLGRVSRTLTRHVPLDALVLPVPRGDARPRSAVVDRGIARPPWPVAGVAQALPGRAVCFTGRTSGRDRCGRIAARRARPSEVLLGLQAGVLVRCTTIRAQPGDSGGPVYTFPRSDGTVRAVGIVTLIAGPQAAMCFTPVRPVLDQLRATVVTAGV